MSEKSSLRLGDPEWDRIQTWLESPGYHRQVRAEYVKLLAWINLNFGTSLTPNMTDEQVEQAWSHNEQ